MKTIIAAVLISVSSAFAEDVNIYVHEGGGGPPSLNDYIFLFRYRVEEGLRLAEGHDNPLTILQMNPEIKRTAATLMSYGFTRAQIEREFQIAIAQYEVEVLEEVRSAAEYRRLWGREMPAFMRRHAIPSKRELLKMAANQYVRSRGGL